MSTSTQNHDRAFYLFCVGTALIVMTAINVVVITKTTERCFSLGRMVPLHDEKPWVMGGTR